MPKMDQIRSKAGLRPDPLGELKHSPDPLKGERRLWTNASLNFSEALLTLSQKAFAFCSPTIWNRLPFNCSSLVNLFITRTICLA